MTREQEIEKAALDTTYWYKEPKDAFREGARWADEHPHWISFEEALPPIGEYILLRLGGYAGLGYTVVISKRDIWEDGRIAWMSEAENALANAWMPLPAMPEAEPYSCFEFPNI